MTPAPKPAHKEGDTRIVRRFLLLPRKLKGEWRWMKWAHIWQVCRRVHHLYPDTPPECQGTFLRWCNAEWANEAIDEAKRRLSNGSTPLPYGAVRKALGIADDKESKQK